MEISIIIATYNASSCLQRCLDSIVVQLTNDTELIIIDGSSQDSTLDIIKKYQQYIAFTISEKDKGIYDAWNKGIKYSRGKWIAFIGADDILLPGAIQKYLNVINTTPDISSYDYICGHNEYVDYQGRLLKILGVEPKWSIMRRKMAPAHVASLHNKKNLFESIGDFDYQNFRICADYELLIRKKNNLKYIMISDHIAQMKVGGMSFSTKAIKETYRIRKKHHSVSSLLNALLYVEDRFAYHFFIIRKTLGGAGLAKMLGYLKGKGTIIDENIPISYLLRLIFSKGVSLLWGMIRFRTFRRVFLHPSSRIKCISRISFGNNLNIESGCYIDALSKDGLILGNNVSFGYHTCLRITGSLQTMGTGIKIGNNVGLGSHGFYGCGVGKLVIGDDCIFGNYVSIHPENHNFKELDVPIRLQGVSSAGGVQIGKNCWIGAKVTVLDGTKIGDGCIVAAGAVVKGEYPDNVVIGGVPAKILKHR